MKEVFKKLKKYHIWEMDISDLKGLKYFIVKIIRIAVIAGKDFLKDKCHLQASAITYYTLMSIVPLFAMIFGIAKGFGMEEMLETSLNSALANQQDILKEVIGFSKKLLTEAKGGVIAGVGIIVLFWTVIKLLGNIEHSFNEIWGVKQNRTLIRKFTDYLSIMLICPILIILSSTITVFVRQKVLTILLEFVDNTHILYALADFTLQLIPYCFMWFVLTFIYILIPNRKVTFKSGLAGGIIAGSLFQIVQVLYVYFQTMASQNAIYGTFAALPLFLLWLNITWIIVMYGAEISFAFHSLDDYEANVKYSDLSFSIKKKLKLRIMSYIISNFKSKKSSSLLDICNYLKITEKITRSLIFDMVNENLIVELKAPESTEDVRLFYPANPINEITINSVISDIENYGIEDIKFTNDSKQDAIEKSICEFNKENDSNAGNILLKDI